MKMSFKRLVIVSLLWLTHTAQAVDLAAVDKVSVMMPREQVEALLGKANDSRKNALDLLLETYAVANAAPLSRVGFVYDERQILVGQSYVFDGDVVATVHAQLLDSGFTLLSAGQMTRRFSGFDDDTRLPVVAVVEAHPEVTTLTVFYRPFHDARSLAASP